MRPYKASRDITREDTWYAMVYRDGHWWTLPTTFKTWREAINEARNAR